MLSERKLFIKEMIVLQPRLLKLMLLKDPDEKWNVYQPSKCLSYIDYISKEKWSR